jgi:nitronate monooxygenase
MWPSTRLQAMAGITHPIIQAPMAGFSTVDMAVSVCDAGGLGSLACAAQDPAAARATFAAFRSRTDRPINVNFFAHDLPADDPAIEAAWLDTLRPYYRELGAIPPKSLSTPPIQPFGTDQCAVMEELRPSIVSFHFGLPEAALVTRLKTAGILIMSTATTVAEARWLEQAGCDLIIAQGYEAGGHRGMFLTLSTDTQVGTMALVPQIVDAIDVPVIAAGGIADGRGIAAALALGASGVQIGTAYLQTDEAATGPLHRASLRSAQANRTVLTTAMSGRPTRCLENRATRELRPQSSITPSFPKGFTAMAPLRAMAEQAGSSDFSAQYCGQAVALSRPGTSADLTSRLATDALERLGTLAGKRQLPRRQTSGHPEFPLESRLC